jgi:hypothetical protein
LADAAGLSGWLPVVEQAAKRVAATAGIKRLRGMFNDLLADE